MAVDDERGVGTLALARAPVAITLVDRTNHHLFQPLLYQVAMAVLAPGEIAAPVRHVLRRQTNAEVWMAEVVGLDPERRVVRLATRRELAYDVLVLATGARHSYFGHDEWAATAPGLKSLADATGIRARILSAFERAELTDDANERAELLTFVLVGAGPTGVEMAGAIAEMARLTLATEFRHFDPRAARIVLLEAAPRILGAFGEELAGRARRELERLGVEVRTGGAVEGIDASGVVVAGRPLRARTVIWTAGVEASPAAEWLGVEPDRAGRVRVGVDCSVAGRPEVFVIGDTAAFEQDGKALPGVAQVALQQGRYVATVIARRVAGAPPPAAFRYRDKGSLATIGWSYAILQAGRWRLSGRLAQIVWGVVHIQYLIEFGSKLAVFARWAWTYLTRQHGSRLIVDYGAEQPPRAPW